MPNLPALHHLLSLERQRQPHWTPIPPRKHAKGEHDARRAARVGHVCMPQAEIAQDHVSFFDDWLDRWCELSVGFEESGTDG